MDGQIYVDEQEDVLCLWRADLDRENAAVTYGMDIFSRVGALWRRDCEEHVEYVHSFEALRRMLEAEGFTDVTLRCDGPQGGAGRQFVIAKRGC